MAKPPPSARSGSVSRCAWPARKRAGVPVLFDGQRKHTLQVRVRISRGDRSSSSYRICRAHEGGQIDSVPQAVRTHRTCRPERRRTSPVNPPRTARMARTAWPGARARRRVFVAGWSAISAASPRCTAVPRRLGCDLGRVLRFRSRSPRRGSPWGRVWPWSNETTMCGSLDGGGSVADLR
jgi:hypothetical protein